VTGALTRAAGENVGNYAINQGSLAAGNYTIVYTGASLTVTAAPLAVTAAAKSKTYGAADPALTWSATGYQNGDTASVVTGTLTRAAGENVGNYAINQGSLAAGNYTISYTGANLTVTAATLNVTAAAKSKTYGTADPALTWSATGYQNGDTSAVVTGALTRAAGENVGNYAINQGSLAAGNYTIVYTGASLTVSAAPLTVTADDKSKTQGAVNPLLTVSYSGFVNGDTAASLTVQPTATTTAVTDSPSGNYPITASGGVSSNYNFNYVAGTLTVTVSAQAPSTTITAKPPVLTNSTTAVFSFTSDNPLATFECKLDAQPFAVCTSPATLTITADGSHSFTVKAKSDLGVYDPAPPYHVWTVDTTSPTGTAFVVKPANPTASSTAQFTFTNPEPTATFECRLDAGSFAPCSSPVTYASLADGSHTVNVRAIDAAGNPETVPAAYTWSIAEHALLKSDGQADAYFTTIADASTALSQLVNPTGVQLLLKGWDFAEAVNCTQNANVFLGGGYSDGFTVASPATPAIISSLTIGSGCTMTVDNIVVK
jgi:hypothetical protein